MLFILSPHAERSQLFNEPINTNDCNCHSNDVSSQDKDKNSLIQCSRKIQVLIGLGGGRH